MKLMFVSDIHGSIYYAKRAIDIFEKEKADQLIILGDVLYHGPRNPLPKDYSPSEVAELLNAYKGKIIAIRGNCDSEVDQMVLNFPMMADYNYILYGNKRLFLTHGHIYNENNMDRLSGGDVLIHGHTHIPVAKEVADKYVVNPGSITLPKENNPNSYGILENNLLEIKDIEGSVLKSIRL
ncbi:phosphodiesterase [Anaeromicrobium sediminis]|uniref:Phosphoesterase n=1 Tax=Anaeromicrobium sediminis TaxID=1478221 RepID=A0A267MMB4_9FIRM|nr:phosphodiesterase [Anaeromicrobium sediminis]PAB60729.1 YfcE family phosphodiesterase [Anaeromicrobium sediminis]